MRALPGKASRVPPGPRLVTRDAASSDQRRRIYRAAADLFAELGYRETTAEAIIRRARVGYGTFYKHFSDKEACLFALFESTVARSLRQLEEVYESTSGAWSQKISAVLATLFGEIQADPTVARTCLVEYLTAGPTAIASYDAAMRRFEAFFESGRDLSPRPETLPKTLEGTIASGVLWIASQQLRRGSAERLGALLPETIEFVLRPYVGEDQAGRAADELAGSLAATPA